MDDNVAAIGEVPSDEQLDSSLQGCYCKLPHAGKDDSDWQLEDMLVGPYAGHEKGDDLLDTVEG